MTATTTAKDHRLDLYKYAKGIAYMSGINLSKVKVRRNEDADKALIKSPNSTLNNGLLQLIAIKLNISVDSLKDIMSGNNKPFDDLLSTAKLIGQGEKLQSYLHSLPTPQISLSAKSKSKTKTKAKPKRKRHLKASVYNVHLANYIKAVAYLQGKSLDTVAKETSTSRQDLDDTLLYSSREAAISKLRDMDIVTELNIAFSMKDLNAILKGSVQPLEAMEYQYRTQVHNATSLWRYMNVVMLLHDTSAKEISKKLGHKSGYLKKTVLMSKEDVLEPLFYKVAKLMKIQPFHMQTALIRAGLRGSDHAYRGEMQFFISYNAGHGGPIGYKEPLHKKEKTLQIKNRAVAKFSKFWKINRGSSLRAYKSFRSGIDGDKQIGFQRALRGIVARIISTYSYLYNFNYVRFFNQNFKNFFDYKKQVYILEDRVWVPIKDSMDWTIILPKLKLQLDAIQNDYQSLAEIQKQTLYAPYIHIQDAFDGELSDPKAPRYEKDLSELDPNVEHLFYGKFVTNRVGTYNDVIKEYGNRYRIPQIVLNDVKVYDRYNNIHPAAVRVALTYGKRFIREGAFQPGDEIKFIARPEAYYKGSYGTNSVPVKDYKLVNARPVSVKRVHNHDTIPVPDTKEALTGFCIATSRTVYKFPKNYVYIGKCKRAYRKWQNLARKAGIIK